MTQYEMFNFSLENEVDHRFCCYDTKLRWNYQFSLINDTTIECGSKIVKDGNVLRHNIEPELFQRSTR